MNLTGTIESAERQFRQILEEFFISVYDEKSLPSHGIDHHRKVWNNAKEILSALYKRKHRVSSGLVSSVIIASYLHDLGMSVDRGFRHGIHSRDFTVRFLSDYNLDVHDFPGLLDAIENHDKKDYDVLEDTNDLLTILSVADDLEAFGFTGIYRYSEIYLTRGINPVILGKMIIENAEKRFRHFRDTFGDYGELFQKHEKRYNVLIDFFTDYNKWVPSYQFNFSNPSGHCGVIELFMKMTEENTDLEHFINQQDRYQNDREISWFINGLKSEI
jgi:hypothetical protein